MYFTINVYELMQNRSYPEAGTQLYQIMSEKIDDVEKIDLNLANVSLVPSMFLNVSFGRFIRERGADFIKQKITFSNITANQAKRIKEYVERFA